MSWFPLLKTRVLNSNIAESAEGQLVLSHSLGYSGQKKEKEGREREGRKKEKEGREGRKRIERKQGGRKRGMEGKEGKGRRQREEKPPILLPNRKGSRFTA